MSAPNTSTDPNVVIRCGHIIPQIRLTPPDSRPAMAPSVPEQDLGSERLYVPLRTEEVGWEEGGLIWAPKRYCYPTVNLYGGVDDHVIGQYRGGPKGYRFINITDPSFALAQPDEAEIKSTSAASSSKSRGRSQMPKGPLTFAPATQKDEDGQSAIASTSLPRAPLDFADEASMCSDSASSSASSSRQGSFSTDDGASSGADTGMTTPTAEVESPISDEKDTMSEKLQSALSALKDQESTGSTKKLASRTKAGVIEADPVDAARLGGPYRSKLNSNALGHDRTLTLTESVPEQHFSQHAGRSTSKLAALDYLITDDHAGEYAAGWAYEQNTQVQYTAMQPIQEEKMEDIVAAPTTCVQR